VIPNTYITQHSYITTTDNVM